MCTALPLDELRTKFKYENKQGAVTQNLGKQELQLMCTAPPLMRSIPAQDKIQVWK